MGLLLEETLTGTICGKPAQLGYSIFTDDCHEEGSIRLRMGFADQEPQWFFDLAYADYDERWIKKFWKAFCHHESFREQFAISNDGPAAQVKKKLPKLPVVPNHQTSGGQSKIDRLIAMEKKGRAKFKDYASLKSGRDRFSSLKLAALLQENRLESTPESMLDLEDKSVLAALRWMCRGLPEQMAIRKVKTDLEVSENSKKSRR